MWPQDGEAGKQCRSLLAPSSWLILHQYTLIPLGPQPAVVMPRSAQGTCPGNDTEVARSADALGEIGPAGYDCQTWSRERTSEVTAGRPGPAQAMDNIPLQLAKDLTV